MNLEVLVPGGWIRGRSRDGVTTFLSIPYAAAPVGPRRFQAPEPPDAWPGVRDAGTWGATAPKPRYREPFAGLLLEPDIPGEEYLTLNVWTPAGTQVGDNLPVMVWIHGGAFGNGTSAVSVYNGHSFARDGVVLVSLNYRLGIEGFAVLPDGPANRGLLDQIAALEWIRDIIDRFGGDPSNVTVFGESAGAMSITTLLAIPRARDLFAKAITSSGAAQAIATLSDAAHVNAVLGEILDCEITASCLSAVPMPQLLAAQRTLTNQLDDMPDPARFSPAIVASRMPFIPIIDGCLIDCPPLQAISAGAGAHVPLMTGTNAEENRLFMVPTGAMKMITDEALANLTTAMGIPSHVVNVYRHTRPHATAGELLEALTSDAYFRHSSLAVAEARANAPAATFLYEFAWRSPAGDLGACHYLDNGFVFDNLHVADNGAVTGHNPPPQLAETMHRAWINFARNGDPGWPPYGTNRDTMIFDGHQTRVVADYRKAEREAWSSTDVTI